jgi:hypothetical protein
LLHSPPWPLIWENSGCLLAQSLVYLPASECGSAVVAGVFPLPADEASTGRITASLLRDLAAGIPAPEALCRARTSYLATRHRCSGCQEWRKVADQPASQATPLSPGPACARPAHQRPPGGLRGQARPT